MSSQASSADGGEVPDWPRRGHGAPQSVVALSVFGQRRGSDATT